jgi:hypothetical protein
MSTQATSLVSEVATASNVLLLAPSLDAQDDDACLDLLTVADPAQENVLSVTFTQSATDRVQLWDSHVDERPAHTGIISIGEMTRSTSANSTTTLQPGAGPLVIETVSDPSDFTNLGMTISSFLSEWDKGNNQTVGCFHSITALLQYASLQRVFRFLHVLTGRIETSDAVAHYHMDPSAHDQQTISTLTPLFDAIIELNDDGEWSVRHHS